MKNQPFTDLYSDDLVNKQQDRALYAFTDGSVKGVSGGYGYHIIPQSDYHHLHNFDQEHYGKNIPGGRLSINESCWLSKRCSIDFCEAYAIRDALARIDCELRNISDLIYQMDIDDTAINSENISTIRIISDSQTVLRWIQGLYTIRNMQMKAIIDDIHWSIGCITELNPGLNIIFQWVKSHEETKGNEQADALAKSGMEQIEENKDATYNVWKFYSMRAAINRNKQYYQEQMNTILQEAIDKTRFGDTLKKYKKQKARTDYPFKWSKQFKKELTYLSRDMIRHLIAVRTGHTKLNYYLSKGLNIRDTEDCKICGQTETIQHILDECDHPIRLYYKQQMIDKIMYQYQEQYKEDQIFLATLDKEPLWHPREVNTTDLATFIFPAHYLQGNYRYQAIRIFINFYRKIINYN